MADRRVSAGRARRDGAGDDAAGDCRCSMPAAMFTGPGLLTLADLLPVMTAFVDRDLVYRFMNKPLADWLGKPRREVIGRTMARGAGRARLRRAQAADRGGAGRASASSSPRPSTIPSGAVTAQSDYVPWVNPATGAVDGVVMVITDVTEQRVDRAGAARERGAVPADRQFGAGDDVGHPARPRARLRQRRLCRFRRRSGQRPRGRREARLAHPHPPRRRRRGSSPNRIAGEASCTAVHARGPLPALRRRVALAAQRVAAALRRRRRADRVHRGRDRHHAGQGGRARASPPGRGADARARG